MIPKKIHYCWFGGNPLPKLGIKCIKSWKKHCRDYEIIRWDESNFKISECPLYVRQAYEAGKWAFVTDYVRLKVLYDFGGIYLDTDVEMLKNPDHLLEWTAFFGMQHKNTVATGLGFGAEKGALILQEMLEDYAEIPFVLPDGSYDLTGCPVRNTLVLERHGYLRENKQQILDGNILILPQEYLNPKEWASGAIKVTKNTISIHHYDASWFPEERQTEKLERWKRHKRLRLIDNIRYFPNRAAMALLGEDRYQKMKNKLSGK